MLDPELLALLVCPETHQDLVLATVAQVEEINRAIHSGRVLTVGGGVAGKAIDGALIRSDRAVAYPILDRIPVMLVSEGLILSPLNLFLETAIHA